MNCKLTLWLLVSLSVSWVVPSSATAHFPWLVRNQDNKAQLFFGEGLNDRTYKLPPSVVDAKILQIDAQGKESNVPVSSLETEKFVGLESADPVAGDRVLASSITYGLFRGSKLQYTALSFSTLPADVHAITLPKNMELQAKIIDTDSGISVFVTWEGKPLPYAKVYLYDADAEEGGEAETDASGMASFTDQQVHDGLNAIRVGHKVAKEGKLADAAYSGEMHYLTATFTAPASRSAAQYGPLPFALTSFGAATDGKSLFVYGGHLGDAHSYALDEQSDKLFRLDLSDGNHQWQEIATGIRLQGTAMVSYRDELIIVGGFQARNKAGEAKDLHSLADVRAYNTKLKAWSELPALPEPRSSHDAAMVGSTVYVVGGWNMAGDAETHWHTTAWKMDLSKTDRKWEPVAAPPFQRRALAAIEHQGKLVVVGGMNRDGGPTKAVALFDPQSNAWSTLPDLVGQKSMAGFGASGWSVNGKLVVTTQEGKIEELAGEAWKITGETKDARFFHRILPVGDGQIVAIGGASMEVGKFTDTELIRIER